MHLCSARGLLGMPPRVFLAVCVLVCCAGAHAQLSSFWAPLFDRRILNYRVDAVFDPDVARSAREHYAKHYGYRGERLIAALGNGEGPGDVPQNDKMYEAVKFYYT